MTLAKNTANLLAVAAAAVALAGTAQAGTWSNTVWATDTELLAFLSPSATYTHAIDVTPGTAGSEVATNIAGVNFTQYGGVSWQSIPRSGTHLATGKGWSYSQQTFFGAVFPLGPTGTESTKLKTGMLFASISDGPATLTLSGLSPNTDYIFTLFSPKYDTLTRTATLDGGDDGVGNTLAVTGNNSRFISYAYNTGAGTTFVMTFTPTSPTYEYEWAAFTNEEVGAPVGPSDGGTVQVKTIVLESKDVVGIIQWQASANGSSFTNLTGATSKELDVTALYPHTPWFRVEATNGGEPPDYSPSIKVTESVDGTVISFF